MGGQHAVDIPRDARRTTYLERLGFSVIRFWNNAVLRNTDDVKQQILNVLDERRPSPVPR